MKIFISWSGERSKKVAVCLKEWIQNVIQGVEVWISHDILVGQRWFDVILKELAEADFCIACLTRENFRVPWMLFEAGAVANKPGKGFACAYLIDMREDEIDRHPFSNFQMAQANEHGTWELIRSINTARGSQKLDQDRLEKAFRRWWQDLDEVLKRLPNPDFRGHPERNWYIIGKSSELYLEVAGSRTVNEALIQVGAPSGTPNQIWRLQEAESGFFSVTALHSGKCLDVEGSSRDNNAKVHQWDYRGSDNQQWSVTLSPGGHYRIAARHSGLYLDCRLGRVVQAERADENSQRWIIQPA